MTESPLVDSGFDVYVFSPGADLIACLNKAIAFLTAIAFSSSGGNNANRLARVVKCYNCQGEGHMDRQCTHPKRLRNVASYKKAMLAQAHEAVQTIIPNNVAFQNKDLDTYDSDCDDISNAKAVLMANISNYVSDVISEVPHSETYLNDMENQGYQNLFYLKKAQRIKLTLYDGIVISAKHVTMPVIDDEETLVLEEESRSKMSSKEKDPEPIK
nr:hypothetical protein [Tanacetum cinerariifolium]